MIDAYEMSAERLMKATAGDRDWVLAQIGPEERIRIVAKLRDMVEGTGAPSTSANASHSEHEGELAPPSHNLYPRLMLADGVELEKLLEKEPDWVIALLVQDARWSWVEQFLSSLEPARLERIENWVRTGNRSIKPAVIEQLFRLVNDRLLSTDVASSAEPTAFEDILARLRAKTSTSTTAVEAAQPTP